MVHSEHGFRQLTDLLHSPAHTCSRSHTHPQTLTPTRTSTYAHIHTHADTVPHALFHTQSHTHTLRRSHTPVLTYTHTLTVIHTHSCSHTLLLRRSHAHTDFYTLSSSHIHTRSHTHPHKLIHTHALPLLHTYSDNFLTHAVTHTLRLSLIHTRLCAPSSSITRSHTHTPLRRLHSHSLPLPCSHRHARAHAWTQTLAARGPAPAQSTVALPALWAWQPLSPGHSSSIHRRQAVASPRRPAMAPSRICCPGRDGGKIYWNIPCAEKDTPLEKGFRARNPKEQPQARVGEGRTPASQLPSTHAHSGPPSCRSRPCRPLLGHHRVLILIAASEHLQVVSLFNTL